MHKYIRNSVTILFLVLITFNFGGCKKTPMPEGDEDCQIIVFLSTQSLSSSLLKSTASNEEKEINGVILFGVDAEGDVIQIFRKDNPSSSGIELLASRSIRWLYAIANPDDNLKEVTLSTVPTVSKLLSLTANFTTAPNFPLLMSGKGEVNNFSATIKLNFVVAKVEIIPENGFQITSVTVQNTLNQGFVFDENLFNGNQLASPDIPTDVGRTTYTYTSSTLPNPLVFYIAENNATTTENSTKFLVNGTVDGKQITTPYPVELKKGDVIIPVLRNKHYTVSVKPTPPDPYKNGIKVLAIGNSYSQCAMLYTYDLLTDLGLPSSTDKTMLVNAFIAGSSLQNHAANAKNNSIAYRRMYFIPKGYDCSPTPPTFTLKSLIQESEWDVITLQQESSTSGQPATYNQDLVDLINFVKTEYYNKWGHQNFKLGWHMTWAYASGYSGLSNYGNNQRTMYEAICNAVQEKIVSNPAFDFIIPVGTAIQNARRNDPDGFGDILTRDGTHLNNLGCYIAAVMWIKTIFKYDISKLHVPYNANNSEMGQADPGSVGGPVTIDQTKLTKIVNAVNAADASPFESP